MATQRRGYKVEDEDLAPAQGLKVGGDPGTSNIAPAVPAAVIYKLLTATFLMAFLPIGSYFASVNTVFGGNSTFAGITAAVVANVVLVGYIVVAYNEDKEDQVEAAKGRARAGGAGGGKKVQ